MSALANPVMLPDQAPVIPQRVYWGCHDSPLGPLLMGMSEGTLCKLECASGYGLSYDLQNWVREWPETQFIPDASASASLASQLRELALRWGLAPLALYGREFQLKIWKAVLQLEPGKVMSYGDIAALVRLQGTGTASFCSLSPIPS